MDVDLQAIRRREAGLAMEQLDVIRNRVTSIEELFAGIMGAMLKEQRVTNALLVELIKATGK